jgi:dipeptidyl aminopeptidase/acylaminoacyl peptidase
VSRRTAGASARLAALILSGLACAGDPVTTDPPADPQDPARLGGLVLFESHGARLNGLVYEAAGPGPHPTLVLLHGYPGNERNLDLAQALRRSGWNVVFFHYRGAWGSGGEFSFSHVLEDVASVVAQVRAREFAETYRVDPERIALVGHSMGGFAALVSASELAEVRCAVSIAGGNLGLWGQALEGPAEREALEQTLETWGRGPIRDVSGPALVADVLADPERFDTRRHATRLAAKPVLLVAGSRDEVVAVELHHDTLVAALEAADARRLRHVVLDADHAFSDRRIALARLVAAFLRDDCDASGT